MDSQPQRRGSGVRVATAMTKSSEPVLLVEVTRGEAVESRHFGSAVIADTAGVRWSVGDPEGAVFPRSTSKPVQALALIESGAADRFDVSDEEVALACASHSGAPEHVELVAAWLKRLKLNAGNLCCGTHWPMNEREARLLAGRGETPTALHNNCSGKHTGFLTTALHLAEPLEEYVARSHPTQQRWLAALEELADISLSSVPVGIDGCSIPSPAIPLAKLARVYARFANREGIRGVRAAAMARIEQAMGAHPRLVAGEGRLCTRVMMATEGRVLVKVGADGVFAAWIPEIGVGLALKISDGALRASSVAIVGLIRRALGPQHALYAALEPLTWHREVTCRGAPSGVVRLTSALA
jgi:L-asparaginase II